MSEALLTYEQQRLKNIEANNSFLREIGLSEAAILLRPPAREKVKKRAPVPAKRKAHELTPPPEGRRSRRLSLDPVAIEVSPVSLTAIERAPAVEKPPDIFGEIGGFPCGSAWETRADCCADLVHRATVAGIVGTPEAGCYSIVLNGGYADDVDHGELLTYTGSGGRSLKGTAANPKNLRTGPATHDQTLAGKEGRYNASLHKSFETGEPVRVVRGYKLESAWAPLGIEYGGRHNYRYDGLYKVEKAWHAQGLEGFKVWKFALKRLPDQPALTLCEQEEARAAEDAEAPGAAECSSGE